MVRCNKIGGPARWRKIRGVQNFQGANFQYIYHLTGFQNAFQKLQENDAPYEKEHLSHTGRSHKSDIESLFCRGDENNTI